MPSAPTSCAKCLKRWLEKRNGTQRGRCNKHLNAFKEDTGIFHRLVTEYYLKWITFHYTRNVFSNLTVQGRNGPLQSLLPDRRPSGQQILAAAVKLCLCFKSKVWEFAIYNIQGRKGRLTHFHFLTKKEMLIKGNH